MLKSDISDLPCGTNVAPLAHRQIADLLELQRKATAPLPEEMVQCDSEDFYAGVLDGRGRILGLFDDKALLACSVISWPPPGSPDNLGVDICLDEKQLAYVANLEAAYVLPALQGRGIARILSGMQLDYAAMMGMRHALSTVSPANFYSLKNLFSLGFRIRQIAIKYDKKLRYVMYKNIFMTNYTLNDINSDGLWIAFTDLSSQKDLLTKGYEGIISKGNKDNFLILYIKSKERGNL